MKWNIVILDPEGKLEAATEFYFDGNSVLPKKDNFTFNYAIDHGEVVRCAMQDGFDKLMLIYDGCVYLDGVANQADFTCAWNGSVIGHLGEKLIERQCKYKYNEAPYLIAECFWAMANATDTGCEYPQDKMTLQQKIDRLEAEKIRLEL
jgi:hypothetical protein